MTYIPLHLHSQFSILDSTISLKKLVDRVKRDGLNQIALTDFGNMYGAVDFYKACVQEDVKPIIGIELMLSHGACDEKKRVYGQQNGYPILLLAKNNTGYHNLCRLSSLAFTKGFYYFPRIDKELLEQYKEGLICLSGPHTSLLSSRILTGSEEEIDLEIQFFQRLFGGDFFIEIQRHTMSEERLKKGGIYDETWLLQKYQDVIKKQEIIVERSKALSIKHGVPTVVTNDVKYLDAEDWKAHEILMNVQSGEPCEILVQTANRFAAHREKNPKRSVMHSHELYFKTEDQMRALFSDSIESIEISETIANQCSVHFDFDKKFYPVFIPPELEKTEYTEEERQSKVRSHLRELCERAVRNRYTNERLKAVEKQYVDEDPNEVVRKRLEYELDVICSKEMADYLLIVYDFIAWAKNKKIPVGPGRGSGAGSIVLYLLGITDIEPLRFNLFFERFINPERLSYPDIDVDICMERRAEVIEYTLEKYGKDKVAQIITFGTMKAKMAVKDVGRVLSVPLKKVADIAKLIPDDLDITLDKAITDDLDFKTLYDIDEEARRVIDLARIVEGSIRNTGIHAAGVIISGIALTELIPVCNTKASDGLVTQYSMKPVEQVGMLKIDFLGLKTLTTIQKAVDAIKRDKAIEIDWVNLDYNDKPTFSLLNQGRTTGIFQLESKGMQELAKKLHIDLFEEIIAVTALYRPGPMGMIPSFIARKHGTEKIKYDHEWIAPILSETYGIMVYQEQVMQIASKLANYSLGEGDVLRRAMGKKDHDVMKKERMKFSNGAEELGIEKSLAMAVFDKVEKFASYGFNKSHATAYGYLSYVTAYLKANFPREWLSALMTVDIDDLSKISKHIRECQLMDIAILPPHINDSISHFVAVKEGIRFGLSAIKGVGEGAIESIIEERKNGAFVSLFEFLQRTDSTKVGKKVVEVLILAGAFDFTGYARKGAQGLLDRIYDPIAKEKKEKSKGVMDLFSEGETDEKSYINESDRVYEEMEKSVLLSKEKELIGFYVTAHPLDEYKEAIKKYKIDLLSKIEDLRDQSVIKVAVILEDFQVRVTNKAQRKFAFLKISDGIISYEVPMWPELFEEKSELLEDNQLLFAIMVVEKKEEGVKLQCKWLEDLSNLSNYKLEEIDAKVKDVKKYLHRDQKNKKNMGQQAVEEVIEPLKLETDIDQITMKDILQLKKLLRTYPGKRAVELSFKSTEGTIARINIEDRGGVEVEKNIEERLKVLPYLKLLK